MELDFYYSSPMKKMLPSAQFEGVGVEKSPLEDLPQDILRSGKLPPNHRPAWCGDYALSNGKLANLVEYRWTVDLVGGYYDVGDNVKYGLSMDTIFYATELKAAREMHNVHVAIRWGTDFFLKASHYRNRLCVQKHKQAKLLGRVSDCMVK